MNTKDTVKRLLHYAGRKKGSLLLALLLLLAATAAQVASPLLIKSLFDNYLAHSSYQQILWLVGAYLGLVVIGSLLNTAQSYLFSSVSVDVVRLIRLDLMKKVTSLSMRFFETEARGQLITQLTNDTEEIKRFYINFISTYVVNAILLIGIYIAMFVMNVNLALIALVILPVVMIAMKLHLDLSKPLLQKVRARVSDMNTMLTEAVTAMPIVQLFRQQRRVVEEFADVNTDQYQQSVKQLRIEKLSGWNIVQLMETLMVAFLIWHFGQNSLQGAVSIGMLYAFVDYLNRMVAPMVIMLEQLTNVQRALVSAEKSFSLFSAEEESVDAGAPLKEVRGQICFRQVSFGYEQGHDVLKELSFNVEAGQKVAIVGTTGSGKSTLLNLLLGFYAPQRGLITIDGQDLSDLSRHAVRKHMALVQQDPVLFAGDIRFNVALHEPIEDEVLQSALRSVGALKWVQHLPDGVRTPVQEGGKNLSSGQRQMIAMARALAHDPAILILDEATASIDSESEHEIQRALDILTANRTTLIIAHRLSSVVSADQILVLHQGEIVERGTHQQLMAMNGRYAQMYRLQTVGQAVKRPLYQGTVKLD